MDIGHRAKSLKTHIQTLTKQFPDLRGLGGKVASHFKYCLYNNKNKLKEFNDQFLNGLEHWKGNHNEKYCTHKMEERHQKKLARH